MRIVSIALGMSAALAPLHDASAGDWAPARGAFARYGVISLACERDRDTSLCLGLTCRRNRLDLVSAAGGGGPMDGRTTVRFGGRSILLRFSADDRAVDRIGIAAAHASVEPATLDALVSAKDIALHPAEDADGARHLFGTRNLVKEVERARALCSGARSGRRP